MSDEQRYSEDESKESERDETMKDLDVSQEEGDDIKGGGLARRPAEEVGGEPWETRTRRQRAPRTPSASPRSVTSTSRRRTASRSRAVSLRSKIKQEQWETIEGV